MFRGPYQLFPGMEASLLFMWSSHAVYEFILYLGLVSGHFRASHQLG